MFDIFSWQHIFILLVIALVVVGPKDLPRILHWAGKWVGKARVVANNVRKSVDEMVRENELEELRAQVDALKNVNPLSDIPNPIADLKNMITQSPMAAPGIPAQSPSDTPVSAPVVDASHGHRPPTPPAAS